MVALGEKLCRNDTKPRDGRVCRRQFAPSAETPVRCTADILSTRCRRDKCGAIVEAYATDAYGNTLIFTGPGADGIWLTDDDVQSNYGANSIIYCGYRYDAETQNYYVRNRYYSPVLGRWTTRDPIGYEGGINLYSYAESSPVVSSDAGGLEAALQAALQAVQKPVFARKGAKHMMSGGRYYINYFYTQNLGDVITDGENPNKLAEFDLAKRILGGLSKLSGVGEIIKDMAKLINDNGQGKWVFRGKAWPEITKVYFCKSGKLQSVSVKETPGKPTVWRQDTSEHGQLGGGFVIAGDLGQDREFFHSLFDVIQELVKSSGGE